jgi:hypothetical protein
MGVIPTRGLPSPDHVPCLGRSCPLDINIINYNDNYSVEVTLFPRDIVLVAFDIQITSGNPTVLTISIASS